MKISYSWLKDYVNCNLSPEEIAHKLTFSGLEVENLEKKEKPRGGLLGVLVGKVLTCEPHPDSDHLKITTVDVGFNEPLNIVCGASNVAANQKVAVATVGTKLYFTDPPVTIKKGKIRGVASEGMICAEDELYLGSSHAGIMALDDDAPVGTPLKEYLNLIDEYVFEIGLTANRSDAMGHVGVARDLCALLSLDNYNNNVREKVKVILPDVSSFKKDDNSLPFKISIEDPSACYRYAGVSISGVKVKESPEWLKNKLSSIGLNPINNIVDISNFVLFETGHPLHTFDADKITGRHVSIKKLPNGSKITTLDNIERTLSAQDLMICNDEEPMVIAGVFGGAKSGISSSTTNIFIESAVFDPSTIRRTSKLHGLSTDASFRYERGVDPEMTIFALKRAALLIKEIAGGNISSDIIDVYPNQIERKKIEIDFARINNFIGKTIPSEQILFILDSLDMNILSYDNTHALIAVPTAKYDVTREADLIEEILRIYGYNNVETDNYHLFSTNTHLGLNNEKIINSIADFLSANGFREIINNSLSSEDYYCVLNENFSPSLNVKILNPLSKDLNILRRNLLFGGLQTIIYNINRKVKDMKLYEFGNIYSINPDVSQKEDITKIYNENYRLSLWITGNDARETWYEKTKSVSFFSLKSVVLRGLHAIGLDDRQRKEEYTENIYGECLSLFFSDIKIADIIIVDTSILKYFDIKQSVFYADIYWDNVIKLISRKKTKFKPLPKFPEVRRDLALLLDSNIKYSEIVEIVKRQGSKLIREINLFDVYEGEKLGINKKSYAVCFIIRDDEKTLTDNQIDKIMEQLINLFTQNLNATIR